MVHWSRKGKALGVAQLSETLAPNTSVTPFHIAFPQANLVELRRRIAQTRWPTALPGIGWIRSVPLAYLQELATCWATQFGWQAQEAPDLLVGDLRAAFRDRRRK